MERRKHNLKVITSEIYHANPLRYELRSGLTQGAPPCPYGHFFKWIGYDLSNDEYVRFTKSVFKKLIRELDPVFVRDNERKFLAIDGD